MKLKKNLKCAIMTCLIVFALLTVPKNDEDTNKRSHSHIWKTADVNSYNGAGDTKITREGYEGSMECDSRWVPCGFELFQNVHLAALVMCPANTESPLDFYLNRCYVDCPSNCLPLIIVQLQVFAINQTFCLHYQIDVSLSVSVCVSVSLSLYLSICLQCVIIFARNDQ